MSETGAWMPMYWADYFGDTTHLTTLEHGAYILLLGTYWRRGRPLPDDDKWLAIVCKLTPKRWRVVRQKVSHLFQIKDGQWEHKRLEKEILKSSERLNSARSNCRAGGIASGVAKSKLVTTTVIKEGSKKKGNGADAPRFDVPSWIPSEPWAAYEEMRQRIRKPMTNRARELTICDLEKLHKSGCDPGSVLLQSVKNSWQGVFKLREDHGNGGTNTRQPSKTERAKAAIIRSAVAGGYAPPGFSSETSPSDDAISVFPDAQTIRKGTGQP